MWWTVVDSFTSSASSSSKTSLKVRGWVGGASVDIVGVVDERLSQQINEATVKTVKLRANSKRKLWRGSFDVGSLGGWRGSLLFLFS